MKTGPFKMKGKSPMMKALIGKQNNLPAELKAKILASPATMKKESMAPMKKESMAKMKKAPAKMKKESMAKMMKKSPTKKLMDAPETKKKVTFAEAYKKRDMKTYGNQTLAEYTKEAKRQNVSKKAGKGYDAPKSQMKGSVVGPKTEGGDATPRKQVKTTKTTPKVTIKKQKTVKEARKAVRVARITSGRRSAEVKAAKVERKDAKQKAKATRKTKRTAKKVARVTKRAVKKGIRRGTRAGKKFIKEFNKENA